MLVERGRKNSALWTKKRIMQSSLKINPHYGDPVAKQLFPREYILKYGITNLFRVELSLFWRMLYTIKSSENSESILVFVLDIINHKIYNKKFGYRGR